MSQENMEIVRSVVEPLDGINIAAIDWGAEAVREMLGNAYSPDIELTTLAIPLGLDVSNSYRGLDGLVEYLRTWLEPFSEYVVNTLDYIEAGDCVLVPSRQFGVGAGSGARVELELTTLSELRDGKIVRVHQYDTLEEALEAVGLREQAMSQENQEVEMADEMMVLLRFGGDADDLLPRYLGAVKRWREDDATKNFSPPLMAAHMKTEDGLLVMNLWANDEDHKNFGLKMGPSLEAEELTRPWVEHSPIAHLGWEGTIGAAGPSQ